MQIRASVRSAPGQFAASVSTDASVRVLEVQAKEDGGAAVNGGEFLMLALATCYCNDLYREARRLGIEVQHAEVEASATFAGVGLAATDVRYRATVRSSAPAEAIARLIRETDAVAEVHNTLRQGVPVELVGE